MDYTNYTFEQLSNLDSGTILVDSYENGVRYLIMRGPVALCAYIGVPIDHPLAGFGYDDLPDIGTHYGLTFSSEGDDEYRPKDWHWYGWDFGHSGDMSFYDRKYGLGVGGIRWDVPMVMAQIQDVTLQFSKLRILAGNLVKVNDE